MLAILVQSTYAFDMCDRKEGLNTNCTMVTPVLEGCSIYNYTIHNISGSLVVEENLTPMYGNVYKFNVTLGEGDYLIELCEGTTREIRITEEDESKMIIAIIILLPLLFGLLLLIGAATMNEEHGALKVFFFLLSIVSFWSSLHIALISVVKFYNFPELQALIGTTAYWTGITFFVIVSYFLIYIFYKAITQAAQKKQERLRY